MRETFYGKTNWEPETMALKRKFWNDPASLSFEEKSPAAEKEITGIEVIDEKEDHLTATYWG